MACTFDVPAYWNWKKVTMQLQYEYVAGASYWSTTATVGGVNGDWIVNKNNSNLFYYYSPVWAH
jgi:hypothetical protein